MSLKKGKERDNDPRNPGILAINPLEFDLCQKVLVSYHEMRLTTIISIHIQRPGLFDFDDSFIQSLLRGFREGEGARYDEKIHRRINVSHTA